MITGGGGFIGRNLCEGLAEEFEIFAPSSKELSVVDGEAVERYVRENSIEQIVHAATFTGADRERELADNLHMTFNLHRLAPLVERVLFLGSGAEYDKRFPMEMVTESDIGKGIPESAYGFSKYIANYVAQSTDNIYALRLFGVFGKYEPWQHCFISNLCCKAVFDLPLSIRQDCEFDFLFVEDLVPVVRWFLTANPLHHSYNVCFGKPVCLSEIANEVLRVSGKNLPVMVLKDGMNLAYTADNGRLRAEYKIPFTPLEQSIKKLLNWYDSNSVQIDHEILKETR